MFFWQVEKETPLTEAVINDDIEKVRGLKENKDQVLAKNSLGFNCVELAKYLDRQKILEILEPPPKKIFKVRPKDSTELVTFTEKEFKDFFGMRYLRHLKFSSYKLFKQVIKSCSNIFLREMGNTEGITPEMIKEYETKPEVFTLRAHVYAEKISSGYCFPMMIEWIDEILGYGAFADREIKKGEYIGEYVGVMRRCAFWAVENEFVFYYPNQAWQSFCIDAKTEGNLMRFSNHSYKPNLDVKVAADKGLIHSTYFAARDISIGEQLTWNYGEDFWSRREPPQDIP